MSSTIEGISINQILSMGNSCTCEKSGSSNVGFEVAYASLLKAMAQKEKQQSNTNVEITTNKDISTNTEAQDELENIVNNIVSNNVEITNKDEDVSKKIEVAVSNASKKYGVDENLIKAIIQVESNFKTDLVSSAGAKGLMQVMPSNYESLGITDPFDIEQNINGGTKLLKSYLDMYDGNVEMALMAYNGGPTRMKNRGVKSSEDIYKMPKETQNYVPKVLKIYRGE